MLVPVWWCNICVNRSHFGASPPKACTKKRKRKDLLPGGIWCSLWFVLEVGIMAVITATMNVPNETLDNWEANESKLHLIITYVGLDEATTEAVVAATGLDPEGYISDLAYIADSDWEEMMAGLTINDEPPTMLAKSKIRQLLAASRALALRVRDDAPRGDPLRDDGRGDGGDGQYPRDLGGEVQDQAIASIIDQAATAVQDVGHPQSGQAGVQYQDGQLVSQQDMDPNASVPTPPRSARPKA